MGSGWRLEFRTIARATDRRTAIAAIIPAVASGATSAAIAMRPAPGTGLTRDTQLQLFADSPPTPTT